MNDRLKTALILLALGLVGAVLTGVWYQMMELRWVPQPRPSAAAIDNPMLGATTLLRKNAASVSTAGSLGEVAIPQMADGTMIVGDASGVVTPLQAEQMMAWVRRGNTLVALPRWITPADIAALEAAEAAEEEPEEEAEEEEEADASEAAAPAAAAEDASTDDTAAEEAIAEALGLEDDVDEDKASASSDDLIEVDPVSDRLGVRRRTDPLGCNCPDELAVDAKEDAAARAKRAAAKVARQAALSHLFLPGTAHPLELDRAGQILVSMHEAAEPLWSDDDASAVRVYAEGKGHIVMLANDFFSNERLRQRDHAELLLGLVKLARGKHVTFVKNLNVLPWHVALWRNYKLLIISLAAGLALLFWAAVRRFGPVLPAPEAERRSLLEHIDASGAWLWKANGGRQLLLQAAREDTLALIRRRAPGLFRLPEHEMWASLARASGLKEPDVSEALQQDAASHVIRFTRQIRTLQELRNHYER